MEIPSRVVPMMSYPGVDLLERFLATAALLRDFASFLFMTLILGNHFKEKLLMSVALEADFCVPNVACVFRAQAGIFLRGLLSRPNTRAALPPRMLWRAVSFRNGRS